MLEKAPEAFGGGNTRFTGGVVRLTYDGLDDLLSIVKDTDGASDVVVDPYPAEAFERDLQRVTGGRTDPLLSRVLIDRSYETVRWMADLGVRFEFSRAVTGIRILGSNKTRLQPGAAIRAHHEGIGLSHTLFDLAAKNGIEVLYERQLNRILCDDTGRVIGVEARGPSGLERHHGRAVIVASGGFQANPEMRTVISAGPGAWSKPAGPARTETLHDAGANDRRGGRGPVGCGRGAFSPHSSSLRSARRLATQLIIGPIL